jgi:ADP-ribose pyrophosphatase YjhB (NUDIX family)
VGVGAVVIEGDRVLLIRRGQEPLKGEWSIPGGVLELGETLEEGVRREVAEETGLAVEVVAILEVLDRIVFEVPSETDEEGVEAGDAAGNAGGAGKSLQPRVRYHYVLVDFLCQTSGGLLAGGSDASDARWVAHGELNSHGICKLAPETIAVIEKGFATCASDKFSDAAESGAGTPWKWYPRLTEDA